MDKKRTILDIQKDIDKLHQKMVEKKEKIEREKEALDFKLRVLDKVYLEKRRELEIEQDELAVNEARKELGF